MSIRMLQACNELVIRLAGIWHNRQAISAPLMAIMLPSLIAFVGLSVDVSVWELNKRKLQGAVDRAAYSAAVAAYKGETAQQAMKQAKAVLANAGFVDGTSGVTVTVSNPASQGIYAGDTKSWQVTATTTQNLFFSGLFLASAPSVTAKAVALQGYTLTTAGSTTTTPGKGCILTLDPTSQYATEVTNNGAIPNTTCAIYTNSSNSSALGCYNNCSIAADTYTVGTYYVGNNGSMSGKNTTGISAVADPYASLTTPTATQMGTTCANSNTRVTATSSNVTINPGRYCKGINFSGVGKTLTMNPGTYYVEQYFMVGNGATLNANNVTIVIVGTYCLGDTNNTCQHPDEGWGNSAVINITAPTSGTYAGVAMYFSSPTYRMHNFANNIYFHVQGALYAPNQKLQFNNNSYLDATKCTKIIAYRLSINNNGNMSTDCQNTGVKTIGDVTTTTPGTTTVVRTTLVQ